MIKSYSEYKTSCANSSNNQFPERSNINQRARLGGTLASLRLGGGCGTDANLIQVGQPPYFFSEKFEKHPETNLETPWRTTIRTAILGFPMTVENFLVYSLVMWFIAKKHA